MKIYDEMKQESKQDLKQESVSKVLITGIDGFTGVYLEKLFLNEGLQVYGTVNQISQNKNHFFCDIRDKVSLGKIVKEISPNYVVHLAAISFVGEEDKLLMYDVNIIGTQNLLDSLVENNLKPKKVILASSAAVYGNQGASVLDESMVPKPINHYGYTKLVMEHLASTYFSKLNIVIVRPFNYTGVFQSSTFLIPKIVKHFAERKEYIELGNIDVAREFNHVEDIAQIYFKLLSIKEDSLTVNICSSHSIYVQDIISYLNQIAGYEIKVTQNPLFVRKNEIKELKGSSDQLFTLLKCDFKRDVFYTLKEMYNSYT
ncbi:GDP-mannose 4,6-dehydratase [Ancylomarina sp. YFZ004]